MVAMDINCQQELLSMSSNDCKPTDGNDDIY